MYKELLPQEILKLEMFISNQKKQLENYRNTQNAKQSFIIQKEKDIFQLLTFVNILKNSLDEIELEKVEYANKKIVNYENQKERTLLKNTYHAGTFIKQYIEALKKLNDNNSNETK